MHYQDRKIAFPTRKALALLVYLATERNHHARETMAVTFWPDSTASRARTALRTTLTYLRAAIPNVLLADHHTLQFKPAIDYFLDLEAVEAVFRALQVSETVETEQVARALEAYRGEFLEGFSPGDTPMFENWASLQRERWHQRVDALFNYLSQVQFDSGAFLPALETANRWLAHAPLNEAVYARLMQLYWAVGDTPSALRTFETCREMLAAEFGLSPSPETATLAKEIHEQPQRQQKSFPSMRADKPTPPAAIVPIKGPFVGRQSEFRMLVERCRLAEAGQPQVVVLVGDAGIGKTRLASEFVHWATAQGLNVLRGSSLEADARIPYHPIVDALRLRIEQENAPEDLLPDIWLSELSRLLPELRERYPDLPAPFAPDMAAQSRLFESVARLTLAFTRRAPLVFFVDDVQWADRTSLELLQYLVRCWQEQNAPVFLLLVVRLEALHPLATVNGTGLTSWLSRVERAIPCTTIQLGQLEEAATISYVQSFTAAPATDFGRWLHRETDGYPLFVVEILKELRDRGILRAHLTPEGTWQFELEQLPSPGGRLVALPERIRILILQRLQRLSPPAFELLSAAAVLGHHSTFRTLYTIAAVEEQVALQAIDELLRNQLLRETQEPSAGYQFTHTKIQDVVYTEAGEARRRIFHQRAYNVLQSIAPPAEIAHHGYAAGLVAEAVLYSIAAGDDALAIFAPLVAIEHFETARKHLGPSALDAEQLRHLYIRLGSAHELANNHQAALAAYGALEALGQERGDEGLRLVALVARAALYAAPVSVSNRAKAEQLVAEAMTLAKGLNDRLAESRLHQILMNVYRFTDRLKQACQAGEYSLAIARELNLRSQMAHTLSDLITVYEQAGLNVERTAALEECVPLWRELNNPIMLAESLAASVLRNIVTGHFDEVFARVDEAYRLSEAIGYKRGQSSSLMWVGRLYWEQGDPARAIETMEHCLTLAAESAFMAPQTMTRGEMAYIYGSLGAIEQGLSIMEEVRTLAADRFPIYLATSYWYTATLYLMAGNLEEAKRWRDAIQLKNGPFYPILLPRLANLNGQIAIAEGDYETAREHIDRALMMLQVGQALIMFPASLLLRAQACLGLGEVTAAVEALDEAREIAERLGMRPALWMILALQARIAHAQGAPEKANLLIDQAQQIIRAIAERTPAALQAQFLNLALDKLQHHAGG